MDAPEIVCVAWEKVSEGEVNVSKQRIMHCFIAEALPSVLKGQTSVGERVSHLDKFLPETVVFSDFAEYNEYLQGRCEGEREFKITVSRVWGVEQPKVVPTKPAFHQEVVNGMQASSYRGAPKRLPSPDVREEVPDVGRSRIPIDPFPMPRQGMPAHGETNNCTLLPNGNDKFKAPECALCGPRFDGQKSQTGRVPIHSQSLGFLETQATSKGYGNGGFNPDLMDQYNKNKQKEADIVAQRRALLANPFGTDRPHDFASTTQREHVSFLPALNRDKLIRKGDPQKDPDRIIQMGCDEVDDGELQNELEQSRSGASKKRQTKALYWMTTQRDHFAKLNTADVVHMNNRTNPIPVPHVHQAVSDEVRELLGIVDGFRPPRHFGPLPTEYSENMQDRQAESERETKFNSKGILSVKNGTRQQKMSFHGPRQVSTGLTLKPDAVVPDHFASMTRTLHR